MRAGDALLLELARQAGVRPTIVFHAFHYRKDLGARFSAEGYAAFSGVPIEHVTRVLAVLDTLPERRKPAPRAQSAKTKLPDGFEVPEEWLLLARSKRMWTLDVCRTEGEKFVLHHQGKGNVMASWKAAWLTWVGASWKEDGVPRDSDGPDFSSPEARQAYLENMK